MDEVKWGVSKRAEAGRNAKNRNVTRGQQTEAKSGMAKETETPNKRVGMGKPAEQKISGRPGKFGRDGAMGGDELESLSALEDVEGFEDADGAMGGDELESLSTLEDAEGFEDADGAMGGDELESLSTLEDAEGFEDWEGAGDEDETESLADTEGRDEFPDSGFRSDKKSRKKRKEEEDWEEEQEPAKFWQTMLVFLGLMAGAALICAALWHFSHSDKPGEGGNEPGQVSAPSDTEPNSGTSGAQAEPAVQGSGSQGTGNDSGEGDSEEPVTEPISGTKEMEFTAVEQSVTPKDVVNLRSVPTTTDTENIVTQIQNGEILVRTGINEDTGWSEIEYEGQTLYAASQFLTLDLDYKPAIEASNPNRVNTIDGRIIIFADCNDWITPKEYVNLRTEPSTSEGDETVSCQLHYGEKAHRTGFSPDSGWSRVEYNGQVLYVVTSLMNVTEEEAAEPE